MTETSHTIRIGQQETLAISWGRDLGSVSLFAVMIGSGVYVGSSAMQWAGFFLAFIILFGWAAKVAPKMTITEAREYLDKLESNHE